MMGFTTTALAALALAFSGMSALALAMDRHHQQLRQRDAEPTLRNILRLLGAVLLAMALLPCIDLWGGGAGIVAWTGFLTAATLLLAGLLSYTPRLAAGLAVFSLFYGLWISLLVSTGASAA